jgi:phosphatidylserine/phosphatidylglycerophosphate/cardiolipin synthase-like enzyme
MSIVKIIQNNSTTSPIFPHQTTYFSRLLDLIRQSKETIMACQYVFSISDTRQWQRSNKVFNAIIKSYSRGIDIKILFDRPKPHSANSRANINTAWQLMAHGIPVRCLSVSKTLHIKLLIFDRQTFLAGSHNITNSSLYSPFELTFECRDDFLTNSAVVYFYALWNGPLSEPFPKNQEALKCF